MHDAHLPFGLSASNVPRNLARLKAVALPKYLPLCEVHDVWRKRTLLGNSSTFAERSFVWRDGRLVGECNNGHHTFFGPCHGYGTRIDGENISRPF